MRIVMGIAGAIEMVQAFSADSDFYPVLGMTFSPSFVNEGNEDKMWENGFF